MKSLKYQTYCRKNFCKQCVWLLLLLLSRFNCVRLCATPQMAAHQAPLSLGLSRQEHWSGLPFPSPMHESEKWKWSPSVVSDPQRPHGLQPSSLLRPWDFPGRSTGVGCHCLLRMCMARTLIFIKIIHMHVPTCTGLGNTHACTCTHTEPKYTINTNAIHHTLQNTTLC